jgi:hypothetical protein
VESLLWSVATLRPGTADAVEPTMPCRRGLDTGRCRMKAIVVTDEAAGTAGMTLVERPNRRQR